MEEITDAAGHKVTTGNERNFLFKWKKIKIDTYILEGANLILGDYTTEEQTKVQALVQKLSENGPMKSVSVPVKTRSPLLIFMGQEHDFSKNTQGPLFVYHAPTPFSPNTTEDSGSSLFFRLLVWTRLAYFTLKWS